MSSINNKVERGCWFRGVVLGSTGVVLEPLMDYSVTKARSELPGHNAAGPAVKRSARKACSKLQEQNEMARRKTRRTGSRAEPREGT